MWWKKTTLTGRLHYNGSRCSKIGSLAVQEDLGHLAGDEKHGGGRSPTIGGSQ
jgi:hypothetical protein